jgi:hypothetical protein
LPLGGTVVEVPTEVKTTAQVKKPDGKKKVPPFDGTFRSINFVRSGLPAALLTGFLARTGRVLLLLSGFVIAALLLAGLLVRVLVLLARIRVLAGHQDLPFCVSRELTREPAVGCFESSVPQRVDGQRGT